MPDPEEHRIIQFDELNVLGKAVFLTGAAVKATAQFIDKALERTVDIVLEAERAFKQGRDPNVEDAKILEEHDER
ncbi:MAG: hypothetical protein ACE5G0_06160 [Rhodothermales bacterium]